MEIPTQTGDWRVEELANGYERWTVSGRVPVSRWQKLNPFWWFLDDVEPSPPAWYKPGKAQCWRWLAWNFLRNPLNNFGDYVVGVVDRNYSVYGPKPLMITTFWEYNQTPGWKWYVISLGWLRLPFVSYESKRWRFYAGWQFGGFFGLKWNIKGSPINWF